jgi:hypothetical protein
MTYGKTTMDKWKVYVRIAHGLANVCSTFAFALRNGGKLITNARKVHPASAYFGTCWIHDMLPLLQPTPMTSYYNKSFLCNLR